MIELLKAYKTVIPIGSRVWGGAKETSDYDFVMKGRHIPEIVDKLNEGDYTNITTHVYPDSRMKDVANIKFDTEGKTINLIFYADRHMKVIHSLNKFMSTFSKQSLSSKTIRIALVEGFLQEFIT